MKMMDYWIILANRRGIWELKDSTLQQVKMNKKAWTQMSLILITKVKKIEISLNLKSIIKNLKLIRK